MTQPPELAALAAVSARLGADPLLIQGAGGNTSVKLDAPGGGGRRLWVKASGLWLAEAERRPSFVALDLAPLLRRLEAPGADLQLQDLVTDAPPGMRPSIETVLHAALPHRFVLHTHSVNALAHLVRSDARAVLAERLQGLPWCFVPYARPGLPLLRAVQEAGPAGDILMLANHGLVLGADDLPALQALHTEVERRLRTPARPAPPASGALPEAPGWRPARCSDSHALGTDPASARLAAAGSLYPDHVVFLGPAPVPVVPAPAAAARLRAGPASRLLVVEGRGVLVPSDTTAEAEEMVRCLALVLARVPADAPLAPLSAADEDALVTWDAEAFRRQLARPAP